MANWAFITLLSLSLSILEGYETKPWLEEDLLPKYTLSLYGDGFPYVPTCAKTAPIDGWMVGIGNGARIALFSEYALEAQVLASLSACRDASLEAFRLIARRLLTSDTIGDPFSSSIGVAFTAPTNQALHDFNRFYYGHYEWEFHAAIGREYAPKIDWEHRTWAVGTFGIADQGSPWLRLHLAYEGRCFSDRLEFFLTGEVGLGRHCFPANRIRPCAKHRCLRHFPGFASIRFRYIDAGVMYTKEFESADVSLRYSLRTFAYNLPGREQIIWLSLTVPIAL